MPASLNGFSLYFDDTLSSIKHLAMDLIHDTRHFHSLYLRHRFVDSIYLRYLRSQETIHVLKIDERSNSTNIKDELITDYTFLYKYCHLMEIVVNDITEKRLRLRRHKMMQNIYKLLGLFEEAIYPDTLPIISTTNIIFPPSRIGFDVIKRDVMFLDEIKDFFIVISNRYD
ncbi:hypothetical protein LOTGIDRAFT_167064 [Lottia gigantea]|uniref:Uncharacterized protein n=1 Tax=Lottia gigantea TaxID=225164 RepID=V3ZZW2_LOTGI|nr:hypothetical protein LOTGIDRAFT_167064 [Lottia gigantea]ESO86541.1 hypothetical protein LOTGIDRAFT_167064 [Lottia gigantea]